MSPMSPCPDHAPSAAGRAAGAAGSPPEQYATKSHPATDLGRRGFVFDSGHRPGPGMRTTAPSRMGAESSDSA